MKGAVFAVLCVVALTHGASVGSQNECGLDYSIHKLLPHPNCGQYYQCVHGAPQERSCPPGLHFSPESLACDFPIAANCQAQPVVPESPLEVPDVEKEIEGDYVPALNGHDDPSQAPAICAASGSSGVLVAHEICNRFYKCTFGLPVALRCPSILHYDPTVERCEWPHTVDCASRAIPDEDDYLPGGDWTGDGAGNDDPSQAPAICAAEGSDHTYISHENCNQYYKCWDGLPVSFFCPGELLFDPSKDYCDWAYQVDCGDRPIVENEGNGGGNGDNGEDKIPEGANNDDPSQAGNICRSEGSEGVLVAHENCNQFYKCNFGTPVPQFCPGELLFDPTRDWCEWPENVVCGNRIVPGPDPPVWTPGGAGNSDPSQAPAICAAEDSNNIHVAHENCGKYYQCWAGFPVALDCPAGFYFNPKVDYCDFPRNVDCGNRFIPETLGSGNNDLVKNEEEEDIPVGNNFDDPSQVGEICRRENSTDLLVAHENCNQFYECDNGVPKVRTCFGVLLFDPTRDRCEWRHIVNCGNRFIPNENDVDHGTEWEQPPGGGNNNPSQAAAICAAEGSNNAYVAHENCNMFYQCWGGVPFPLPCPAGFFFNPKVDYCDYPSNVDCANRIIA